MTSKKEIMIHLEYNVIKNYILMIYNTLVFEDYK